MSGERTTQGGERFGCVHTREDLSRVAERCNRRVRHPLHARQRVGECGRPPLAGREERPALVQGSRRIPRAEWLTFRTVPRDHGVHLRDTSPPKLGEQPTRHERHVPREHDHRASRGADERRREAGERPEAWFVISHHLLVPEPGARRSIVGDDKLARRRLPQRGKRAIGDANAADGRQSLRPAPETTGGAPREEDADAAIVRRRAQMRSPRCSAAISSSSVSARSTTRDSSPRRGRSFRNRPQLLHITRS
jgi:hypothetical protein